MLRCAQSFYLAVGLNHRPTDLHAPHLIPQTIQHSRRQGTHYFFVIHHQNAALSLGEYGFRFPAVGARVLGSRQEYAEQRAFPVQRGNNDGAIVPAYDGI